MKKVLGLSWEVGNVAPATWYVPVRPSAGAFRSARLAGAVQPYLHDDEKEIDE